MKTLILIMLILFQNSAHAKCTELWNPIKEHRAKIRTEVAIGSGAITVFSTTMGAWPIGLASLAIGGPFWLISKLTDRIGKVSQLIEESKTCDGHLITHLYHRYKKQISTPLSRKKICTTLQMWDNDQTLCKNGVPTQRQLVDRLLENNGEIL